MEPVFAHFNPDINPNVVHEVGSKKLTIQRGRTASILHFVASAIEDYTAALARAINPSPTIQPCGAKQEQVSPRPVVHPSRRPIAAVLSGMMYLKRLPEVGRLDVVTQAPAVRDR
jgi:hypothetical protein